ncbi:MULTISPECIES: (2Fe-2S)-binding protein [Streptomyces]|uniref:(2Fe-2S)-binding protein n=1 Tax=Streptomyces TaxID=1883 RepID=UPI002B05477D|nr:(2Fe-2S)-binding protein [Streptomyces sp. JHD 1]
MSNDPHADPSAPPPSAPPHGGWGGEYDGDATAFIQLPPQATEDPGQATGYPGLSPLAAPGTGQGWEPPAIPPPTAAATTDPADTGQWTFPFAPVTDEPSPGHAAPGGDAFAGGAFAGGAFAGGAFAGDAFGLPPEPAASQDPAPAPPGQLGQGAAAALAGSHEGRLHADAGVAEPEVGEAWSLPPAAPGEVPDAAVGSGFTSVPVSEPAAPPEPVAPAVPPARAEPDGHAFTSPGAPGQERAHEHTPEQVPEPDPASVAAAEGGPAPAQAPEPAAAHDEHPLTSYTLRVNGTERHLVDVWLGESLLYVLRERLGLAGAKDGCAQGECGACSVQVDGRLVASCLVPAALAEGSEIRTVEGLAEQGAPCDVQRALAARTGVQCGFCLPGMAMTVHDLLEANHAPTDLQVRTALCGNLCRCSGYRGVLDAVREVAAARAEQSRQAAPKDPAAGGPRIPHQSGPSDEGGTQ